MLNDVCLNYRRVGILNCLVLRRAQFVKTCTLNGSAETKFHQQHSAAFKVSLFDELVLPMLINTNTHS